MLLRGGSNVTLFSLFGNNVVSLYKIIRCMYIYNTSFVVEAEVHDRWLTLVREKYIPFLKKEGFEQITLSRVLSVEATTEFTYALQVRVEAIPDYQRLAGELFSEYETIASGLFGDKVLHFATLMKVVEE